MASGKLVLQSVIKTRTCTPGIEASATKLGQESKFRSIATASKSRLVFCIFTSVDADGYTNSSEKNIINEIFNIDLWGKERRSKNNIFVVGEDIYFDDGGCNYFKLVKRELKLGVPVL